MALAPRNRYLIGFNATGDLGPFTIYTSRTKRTVWFRKSPPTSPPSIRQLHYRNRFRCAAAAWRALPQGDRDAWNLACQRAGLYLCGYALWLWWQIRRDRPALRTVERLSRVSLLHT